MKNLLKVRFLVILVLLIIISSCRQIAYTESKAIIVSRAFDVALKDSAVIYGMVYDALDERLALSNLNIWIEEINVKTLTNDTGFFSMKVPSGRYTIKCFTDYSNEEFVAILKDLSILPNEKVEIKFLRGKRSE